MLSIQQIRQAMIKNPHHRLWDKPLHKWTEKERNEFHKLEEKKKRNWVAVNSVKVIRVSDGFEYSSISECRRQNGFCKVIMDRKLKLGIEFKTI
jgi:hypothetical protein